MTTESGADHLKIVNNVRELNRP